MGIEQPNFNTPDIEEEKEERSNVIRGPWQKRNPEEAGKDPDMPDQKDVEKKNNIIEGPWPKKDLEAQPKNPEVKELERAPAPQTPEEREAAVEKIRQELLELSEKNKKNQEQPKEEREPEPREGGDNEDEKARIPFSGGYREFEPCEVCGGKGRRYFIFPCPACGGLGSVVAESSSESGEYVVSKDGSMTKNMK